MTPDTQEEATMDYRCAWLAAINEFNNFGLAVADPKHRIEATLANMMYGLKAAKFQKLHHEVAKILESKLHRVDTDFKPKLWGDPDCSALVWHQSGGCCWPSLEIDPAASPHEQVRELRLEHDDV